MQDYFRDQNAVPCLVLQALLSDEEVGYVPRFITFKPDCVKQKARALFTRPSYCPPEVLITNFPQSCGLPKCEEISDCSSFDFFACCSIAADTSLVRRDNFPFETVRCNYWPCEMKEDVGSTIPCPFVRCQICKEFVYCGKEHQVTALWTSIILIHENPFSRLTGTPINAFVSAKNFQHQEASKLQRALCGFSIRYVLQHQFRTYLTNVSSNRISYHFR